MRRLWAAITREWAEYLAVVRESEAAYVERQTVAEQIDGQTP